MRRHTGERPFKCTAHNDCGKAFKTEHALKTHIKCKDSDDRPFKCNFPGCLRTSKTAGSLLAHQKVHTDERPFSCPHEGCNFRTKSKSHIPRHIKDVHSEAKSFACSKCDYKTARKDYLKRHVLHHSTRRTFKCNHPQCTASFKSSSQLRSHFSNRHEEKTMQCDHPGCGQKFANIRALSHHKRSVHGKKIHACPSLDCSFTANAKWKLADHMIVHEERNEKISCWIKGCGYKGNHRKALQAHVRRHKTLLKCPVSGCSRYAATKEALKDHVKFHNSLGRPFQCPLCFKHFTRLELLQQHCVAHTSEKPMKCGHCQYATARQADIKSHISSRHATIAFPSICHVMGDRECVRCRVTLPSAQFLMHSITHAVPVVLIERLETSWS